MSTATEHAVGIAQEELRTSPARAAATAATSRPTISDVPNGRMALWWVIASEIVIFGGVVACYLLYRFRHPEWGHFASHTSTPLGALNTFVLMTSSLTAVKAHEAASHGDGKLASRRLLMTITGGLIFLAVKSFEYSHEISHGFTLTTNTFWTFYYLMTGLHGLHVIAGMIAMAVVATGAKRGENLQRVEYVGLYWHFVDMVWIFLFPLLYVAR